MKNTICILFTLLLTVPLFSQHSGRDETLFRNGHRSGFFVSSITEFSGFDTDTRLATGGGFGFVIGDFFLGAYGLGTNGKRRFHFEDEMEFGQGGFWAGFAFPQYKAVHGFASLKGGWGALNLEIDHDDLFYEDAFFAWTPEAGLEVNVFRFFRVSGSVGYRFMKGLNSTPSVNLEPYEGLTASLNLRIGWFGRQSRRY